MSKVEVLNIYFERRSSRTFVGKLFKKDGQFYFEYDKKYVYQNTAIPLGPDLPITTRVHKSESLFNSFEDRIPSRKNPAYVEYCQKFNLSEDESDELVLLSTIGHRGPSSFIFEAEEASHYGPFEYSKFRQELGLTLRDFSSLFSISLGSLQKLEKEVKAGKEVLKRIEIYDKFPEVALFELKKNGKLVHAKKKERAEQVLKDKIKYYQTKKKA